MKQFSIVQEMAVGVGFQMQLQLLVSLLGLAQMLGSLNSEGVDLVED